LGREEEEEEDDEEEEVDEEDEEEGWGGSEPRSGRSTERIPSKRRGSSATAPGGICAFAVVAEMGGGMAPLARDAMDAVTWARVAMVLRVGGGVGGGDKSSEG
jgi:hypothetical protein